MKDTEFRPGNALQNTDSLFPCRLTGADESEIKGEQCGINTGESAGNWKVSINRLVSQVSQVQFGLMNGRPDGE